MKIVVSTVLLALVAISASSPVSAFLPDYDRSMFQNGPNLGSFLTGSSYRLEQPQVENNFPQQRAEESVGRIAGRMIETDSVIRPIIETDDSVIRPISIRTEMRPFFAKRSSIMLNRLKQAFGHEPVDGGHFPMNLNIDERRSGQSIKLESGKAKGKTETESVEKSPKLISEKISPASDRSLSEATFDTSMTNGKVPLQPGQPRAMALQYEPLLVSTPVNNSFRRKMVTSAEDEKLMKCFFNPVSCF